MNAPLGKVVPLVNASSFKAETKANQTDQPRQPKQSSQFPDRTAPAVRAPKVVCPCGSTMNLSVVEPLTSGAKSRKSRMLFDCPCGTAYWIRDRR